MGDKCLYAVAKNCRVNRESYPLTDVEREIFQVLGFRYSNSTSSTEEEDEDIQVDCTDRSVLERLKVVH
jgi:hypothetical protein